MQSMMAKKTFLCSVSPLPVPAGAIGKFKIRRGASEGRKKIKIKIKTIYLKKKTKKQKLPSLPESTSPKTPAATEILPKDCLKEDAAKGPITETEASELVSPTEMQVAVSFSTMAPESVDSEMGS